MQDTAVSDPEAVRARKQSSNKPNPSRHSLKCAICNHPDRAAIEFDFLNWRNPGDLVKSYRFRGLSTVYRHAHATGLFAKRRLNLRFAMERIVERVNEVPVTATAVIRAARAIARINDSGEWVDPPSRVIVTHINSDAAEGSAGLESSTTRRSHRQKGVGHSPATSHSPLATVFDEVLLDEPSDSASAELPRIEGKPAPPEVILQLTPEFARCREERWRAIEEDRRAKGEVACPAGHDHGPMAHQNSSPVGAGLALPTPAQQANVSRGTGSQPVHDNSERRSASGLATNPETVPSPTPQREQSVASSTSLLPQAASDKPATAKQSPRAAGPPLGSSGSADPPFPFTPKPSPRWNPRRRF